MSFHFPTKNSQILLDFRPNPGEPSLKRLNNEQLDMSFKVAPGGTSFVCNTIYLSRLTLRNTREKHSYFPMQY